MQHHVPPPYPRKPHASGQARIKLSGRSIYLGIWGTPASHAEYERRVAEWRAGLVQHQGAHATGSPRTVADLVAAFMAHAETAYAGSGELPQFRTALLSVCRLYGHTLIRDFSPRELKVVQAEMLKAGWCNRVVNRNVVRVRTCWRWAESEGMTPDGRWEALRTVSGLPVDENEGRPVPEDDLFVTLPFLGPVPWAIAQTQLLTGARPSEALELRLGDLQRDDARVELARGVWLRTHGKVWVVNLRKHKMRHRGFGRVLLFGPRAQEVLRPFLDRAADAYLFSPREAVCAGQVRRQRRKIGERYRVDSYGHAIRRACERAWVEPWTPYQLRHNAGSRLSSEFDPEIARIVLGHRDLQTTRQYVLDDLEKAVEAIGKVG